MNRYSYDDFSSAVLCNVILKQGIEEVLIISGNNHNGDIE